jgi:tetratricopeptide (TPR) repeat protein
MPKRRRALFSADHPQVVESLVSLGLLRMERDKVDEAEKLTREGLEITQRAHPDDDKLYATVVTALGRVLTTRGDYKQAISVVEDAVRRNDKGVPTAELVKLLTQLASANFYAGNYETSETLNRRILSISRELFGNNHTFVADALINLAAIQSRWGHHKEAEELNRQALSISESWYGKDHPELASNLITLAQELTQLERYDESEKLLMQALEINKRAYPQGHARTAFALNELGSLAFNRDKLDEAEKWFSEAAEISRKTYGDDHFRTITAMSNLASVYSGKKDYARAEQTMRDVVTGFTKISADHLDVGASRIKLGRVLFHERQYQQAETEALAGFEIIMKQKNPNARWIRDACQLLIDIYDVRKDVAKVVKFRELRVQYVARS